MLVSRKINKTSTRALISSGVLSEFKTSRQKMLYEFDTFEKLSNKELEWAEENYKHFDCLTDLLHSLARPKKEGGGVTNKNRLVLINDLIKQLKDPPVSLEDDPEWIVRTEENYYGVSLTFSKVESVDISRGDTTCKDIINGKKGKVSVVATVVDSRKYVPPKGRNAGKEMGFLEIEDATGSIDNVTIFNDVWIKHKNLLYNGNNILIIGKSSKGKRDGIIVDEIFEL
jgi:DNA polymerase III alpha subunit